MFDEEIKYIYALKEQKRALEKQKEDLNAEIAEIDNKISDASSDLLEKFKDKNIQLENADDLVAYYSSIESYAYKDEKAVIEYLKNNGLSKFVKIKTTESIDKNPLKKEFKTNIALKEALDSMMEKKVTECITVTTEERYNQLQEEIAKNK